MSNDLEISFEEVAEDSDTCVLSVNRTLSHGNPTYYASAVEAQDNPLARKVLGVDALEAILVQASSLTLLKPVDGEPWSQVKEAVRKVVHDHFDSLDQALSSSDREMNVDEEELARQIQELIDAEVNPMVRSHGGVITVKAVHDRTLFIHMGGGCQGCAMSTATLKQGVSSVVLSKFPQIEQILDSTDHAAGANPYYAD